MRLRLHISGVVQGVGFRPFIFRLAGDLGLKGYVLNDTTGVLVEAEGDEERLNDFLLRVEKDKPHLSKIYSLQHSYLEDEGFENFQIRKSAESGSKEVSILPDISICSDCREETVSPRDRRFLYLFTNCTNCGPRYTILNTLPYDRENTSMKDFQMCHDCSREYGLPSDRRFHAQPNACHSCGPWISLYDSGRKLLFEREEALEEAVAMIRRGHIVAVKGIGGFHLLCDATNDKAVQGLREKKMREERPLAVMFPDIYSVREEADVNALEERAIQSVERPIVIVMKRATTSIAGAVSPDNATIGVFLPYSPLHHIILKKLKKPVVATSGNITDEPIARTEEEAFARLSGVADYIVSHNRPIVRRCDDSVVRVLSGKQVPVRRSRGFAPLPVMLPFRLRKPVLALGPFMNSTIALGIGNRAYISQHIGDLDNPFATEFFEETVTDFLRLFDVRPEVVVTDMHPGYFSTRFGEERYGDRVFKVQHHHAHVLSCMAENDVMADSGVIGFAFDGTGYGLDGTLWGSEVLVVSEEGFRREFHLRPFRLPGGENAIREPCRTAFSVLFETFGEEAGKLDLLPLNMTEKDFFTTMIKKNVNSPFTTGMGRLFDAVASLIGLRHRVSFHAQSAIALEQLALGTVDPGSYSFAIDEGIIDYRPMIRMITEDILSEVPGGLIARRFHNTIADMIITISESLGRDTGFRRVALTGGVFQNTILLQNVTGALKERGFLPLLHQLVPANDGGISLGQVVAAGIAGNHTG
jgi:hydrogenase maturation protein HypF